MDALLGEVARDEPRAVAPTKARERVTACHGHLDLAFAVKFDEAMGERRCS
jgi:hypothetical protein